MRTKLMLSMTAGLAVILSQGVSHQALAAGPALTGQVSSAEEGAMEGVVVSAKKGIVTVSVVSDDKGAFSFPASKLDAGNYTLGVASSSTKPSIYHLAAITRPAA